jgi:hypothetical protein
VLAAPGTGRITQSPSGADSARSGPSQSAGPSASSSPPWRLAGVRGTPPRGLRGMPAGSRRALRGLTAVTVGHRAGQAHHPGQRASVAPRQPVRR